MAWPDPNEYREAVQNPLLAFTDSELREAQAEQDAFGLPRPISGRFASVYTMVNRNRVWAAKCFTTEISDQQSSYAAISAHLPRVRLQYTVPFTYLPQGVLVAGGEFSLLKMEWVQGEPLDKVIQRNLKSPLTLQAVAKVWVQMVSDLKAANIGHGDLQHG